MAKKVAGMLKKFFVSARDLSEWIETSGRPDVRSGGFGERATLLCRICGDVFHVGCARWSLRQGVVRAEAISDTEKQSRISELRKESLIGEVSALWADFLKMSGASHKATGRATYWILPFRKGNSKLEIVSNLIAAAEKQGIELLQTMGFSSSEENLTATTGKPFTEEEVCKTPDDLQGFVGRICEGQEPADLPLPSYEKFSEDDAQTFQDLPTDDAKIRWYMEGFLSRLPAAERTPYFKEYEILYEEKTKEPFSEDWQIRKSANEDGSQPIFGRDIVDSAELPAEPYKTELQAKRGAVADMLCYDLAIFEERAFGLSRLDLEVGIDWALRGKTQGEIAVRRQLTPAKIQRITEKLLAAARKSQRGTAANINTVFSLASTKDPHKWLHILEARRKALGFKPEDLRSARCAIRSPLMGEDQIHFAIESPTGRARLEEFRQRKDEEMTHQNSKNPTWEGSMQAALDLNITPGELVRMLAGIKPQTEFTGSRKAPLPSIPHRPFSITPSVKFFAARIRRDAEALKLTADALSRLAKLNPVAVLLFLEGLFSLSPAAVRQLQMVLLWAEMAIGGGWVAAGDFAGLECEVERLQAARPKDQVAADLKEMEAFGETWPKTKEELEAIFRET